MANKWILSIFLVSVLNLTINAKAVLKISYDHNLQADYAVAKTEAHCNLSPNKLLDKDGVRNGALRFFTNKGTLFYPVNKKIITPEQGSIVLWIKLPVGNKINGYPKIIDIACKKGFMFVGINAKGNWIYAGYGDNKKFSLAKIADLAQDGNWHQIAVSWNKPEKSLKVYWDGRFIRKITLRGTVTEPENLFIGTNKQGAFRGNMFLDELSLYREELSKNEINQKYQQNMPCKKKTSKY